MRKSRRLSASSGAEESLDVVQVLLLLTMDTSFMAGPGICHASHVGESVLSEPHSTRTDSIER